MFLKCVIGTEKSSSEKQLNTEKKSLHHVITALFEITQYNCSFKVDVRKIALKRKALPLNKPLKN